MYKFKLILPEDSFLNDLQEIVRAFFPYLQIDNEASDFLCCLFSFENGSLLCDIESSFWGKETKQTTIKEKSESDKKRLIKRFLKNSLYSYISEKTNISLPYGSLTGVRPTKLYRELTKTTENPNKYLKEAFSVTQSRVSLIEKCVRNQENIINDNPLNIGLFLNIPFCPSRCSYCSFISTEVFRIKKELPLYVTCVKKDIEAAFEIIKEKNYKVTSIYVGGGTPSSIGKDMLNELLFPLFDYGVEFTVEIGRPDTIDKGILDVLKKNNVTRISINPQTFHQKTLDIIGRKHSVEQIYTSYNLAKSYGFDINMDLIANLSGESYEDFCFSVDEAIKLSPENITIHTLSLKRGSVLTLDGTKKEAGGEAYRMLDYAYGVLEKNGYFPYYMYRQKNMFDNLENTGFCKDGKACKYNIDMMEESASIIGLGCGAMSKYVFNDKIERFSSPKGFREYCERIEKTVSDKKDFYLNQPKY